MVRRKNHGLLIAGDGASAALAALAMARWRPEVPLLLVGEDGRLGGDPVPLLLDESLGDDERELLEPCTEARWDGVYAVLPGRTRKLKLSCRLVTPERIEAAVRAAVPAERLRLDRRIVAVRDTSLLLDGGDTLDGDGAIDARAWAQQTTLELRWRHSLRRVCDLPAPHRLDLPVLIDITVPAGPGCAHFACTPLTGTRLAVEHVRYAGGPDAGAEAAGQALDRYLAARGWSAGALVSEAANSLPVALGGDFAAYYRIGGARVAKLGPRGGFTFPTTGSPLPDAARTALLLAGQRDLGGSALHDLFEEAALASWRRREFHREFDRRLFVAGSCVPLAALFGLDAALVGRFFAEHLGLFDRRKLTAAVAEP